MLGCKGLKQIHQCSKSPFFPFFFTASSKHWRGLGEFRKVTQTLTTASNTFLFLICQCVLTSAVIARTNYRAQSNRRFFLHCSKRSIHQVHVLSITLQNQNGILSLCYTSMQPNLCFFKIWVIQLVTLHTSKLDYFICNFRFQIFEWLGVWSIV